MSLDSRDSTPAHPSHAMLRAGLVGGATLGLAMAGQRMSTIPEMALLGWFIVIFGFFCVGYFAVRDAARDAAQVTGQDKANTQKRRSLLRMGLVSGLIAGIVAGLSFVVMNLAMSLDSEQLQLIRESAMQNMSQLSPEQARMLQNNPVELDQLVRLSYGIATGCCGLMVPIMGMVLGTFGALSATSSAASNKAKED